MEFLIGSVKTFYDFVDSISSSDKVAILTHTDTDGITSGIFIEQILKAKGIKVSVIEFLNYEPKMFDKVYAKLKNNLITKIFITDINADSIDMDGFVNLRENFDVLLIDHHPIAPELKFKEKIIKTNDYDCSGFAIYLMGEKFIGKGWEWLVCADIISDISYKNPENLNFLRKYYSVESEEKILESEAGKLSLEIGSALVYYKKDLRKVYDLVKEKNFEEIKRVHEIVEEEFQRLIQDFGEEAEYHEKENLYFYFVDSRFGLTSAVSTHLSFKEKDKIFILLSRVENNKIKLSARCQSGRVDLNELMKKSIEGLENAVGGGHPKASAASFMEKDLEKFKENLLNELNKV